LHAPSAPRQSAIAATETTFFIIASPVVRVRTSAAARLAKLQYAPQGNSVPVLQRADAAKSNSEPVCSYVKHSNDAELVTIQLIAQPVVSDWELMDMPARVRSVSSLSWGSYAGFLALQ
jgi:hypothetical protein